MKFYIHDIEGEKIVAVQAPSADEALEKYVLKLMRDLDPDFSREELQLAIDDFNGYVLTAYEEMD